MVLGFILELPIVGEYKCDIDKLKELSEYIKLVNYIIRSKSVGGETRYYLSGSSVNSICEISLSGRQATNFRDSQKERKIMEMLMRSCVMDRR